MIPQPLRRHRTKLITAAITATAVYAFTVGPFSPLAANAARETPPVAAKAVAASHGPARTVTLITGDVVHLTDAGAGHQSVQVERPHGAVGGVRSETIGTDLYVFPDEVLPYVGANLLDRRLFDVTSLVKQGYDDQHTDGIPMILSYANRAAQTKSERIAPLGVTHTRSLPSINANAVKVNKADARTEWTSLTSGPSLRSADAKPTLAGGVTKVWLDGKVHANLAESTAQIGAPAAWAAGYDGKGVKVAVLDTGADLNHPDLVGRVSTSLSFVPGEDVNDGNGHGTHTLSTVGGDGAASNGLEKGVAPAANLIVGKVLGNDGSGDDSWVIAGMEWAAAQGARVISMSLGGSDPSDGTDPMSQAVDQLSAQSGALFVIAAGNTGMEGTMSAPGTADAALTVAAVDSNDQLAYFSTLGPRFGDYALKPDIAAPGVDILAALAGGTADTGYYQTMSGTSMATPHVAGAAAIVAEEHPGWSGAQIKDALMSTSKQLADYTAYQVGAGRVDLTAATTDPITATGSAYFGFDAAPYTNEAPVTKTVTYSNNGATAVTLHLAESVQVAGGPYDVDPGADAGTAAPAGMFSLSADTLTVAAHATASVTTTAQPALGAKGRRYLGEIVASNAGAVVARTDVGFYKEDQRYTLHISLTDHAGNGTSGIIELQEFGQIDPQIITVGDTGKLDLRLRGGVYSALTYLDVPGSHGPESQGLALLGNPQIVLDRDRNLTLDARKVVEVTASVPKKTEDRLMFLDWYRSDGADSVISSQYILPSNYDSMFALPTSKVTRGKFEFEARWRKAYPLVTVTDAGKAVSVLGVAGSSLYDGRNKLTTVYAGTGTEADYASINATGKAVLVTRSDDVSGTQRAQYAAEAGAKLLIEINDGTGKLLDYVGTDEGSDSAVPVVSVTATTGATLIAHAGQASHALTVLGVPASPYVYDLTSPYPNQIPRNLSYRPKSGDLATVTTRFIGGTTQIGGEGRWDYRPYRQYAAGFWLKQKMPAVRTDYVSTQPGDGWAESAVTGPNLELVSSADVHALHAGQNTKIDWFGPITRPRDGGGFWSSQRDSLSINFNVQPWGDGGAGHAGYIAQGDNLVFKVYQDGQFLHETDGWASASLYPVPTGTTTYTLDLQASRDASIWPLSPTTHTVWNVVSKAVTDPNELDLMPLLQLDYHVNTDLAGYVKGGWQTLEMSATHLPGVTGAGKIVSATLAVSYDDGKSWHSVLLTKVKSKWIATFKAPAHGYVSIKASASDSKGNQISQQITRAYGLK